MEEDWEKIMEQDISEIKISKVDEDNLLTTVSTSEPVSKPLKPAKPSLPEAEDLSTKENIFKGLTMQQKKAIFTNLALKTDHEHKELGKQLAAKLQQGPNHFGLY
jgi:hypothetical protein